MRYDFAAKIPFTPKRAEDGLLSFGGKFLDTLFKGACIIPDKQKNHKILSRAFKLPLKDHR